MVAAHGFAGFVAGMVMEYQQSLVGTVALGSAANFDRSFFWSTISHSHSYQYMDLDQKLGCGVVIAHHQCVVECQIPARA